MTNEKFARRFWIILAMLASAWIACIVGMSMLKAKQHENDVKKMNELYEKVVAR